MKLETLPDILMEVEGTVSMRKYSSEEKGSASVRKRQRGGKMSKSLSLAAELQPPQPQCESYQHLSDEFSRQLQKFNYTN